MAFYLLSNGGSGGPALESISHPSTQQKSLKHPESNNGWMGWMTTTRRGLFILPGNINFLFPSRRRGAAGGLGPALGVQLEFLSGPNGLQTSD